MSEVNFELQDLAEQERQSVVDAEYDRYVDEMYASFCYERDEFYATYDRFVEYDF